MPEGYSCLYKIKAFFDGYVISDVMKYATRLHLSLKADQAASEQH